MVCPSVSSSLQLGSGSDIQLPSVVILVIRPNSLGILRSWFPSFNPYSFEKNLKWYLLFFCEVCGPLVPWPGIKHASLEWKHGVLTTGPPGKPPKWCIFSTLNYQLLEKYVCVYVCIWYWKSTYNFKNYLKNYKVLISYATSIFLVCQNFSRLIFSQEIII